MTVNIGVIGAGIMGADHARTLDRFVSGARVVTLADLDADRAAAVAATLDGAHAVADAQALIDDPAVDAIIIASHDSTHAALCLAAIEAGKPVLCEKPLAPSSDECARIVDAERSTGRSLLSLGFMRRFDPGYVQIRAAIEAGELGRPLMVHSTGRGVSSGPGTTSESSVTNSAIHDLDIVPWLLGSPVTAVSWYAGRRSSLSAGFDDPQLILLRTADGVLSTVEVLLNARYGYDVRCDVLCETGALQLIEPTRVRRDTDLRQGAAYAADWRPRFADAYRLELQAWVDGLSGRAAPPLADAADGLRASVVADAVIASMHAGGRTVTVAEPATGARR